MSIDQTWNKRWVVLAKRLTDLSAETGLGGIASALRDGFEPLSPLAAQVLWVAQPSLALFGQGDAIGALAEYLEDPQTQHHDSIDKAEPQ